MPSTILYSTEYGDTPGLLYLPGDPAEIRPAQDGCALCGLTITERPDYWPSAWAYGPEDGEHAGLLYLPQSGEIGEWIHLRCVSDVAEQGYVSASLTLGAVSEGAVARHAVPA